MKKTFIYANIPPFPCFLVDNISSGYQLKIIANSGPDSLHNSSGGDKIQLSVFSSRFTSSIRQKASRSWQQTDYSFFNRYLMLPTVHFPVRKAPKAPYVTLKKSDLKVSKRQSDLRWGGNGRKPIFIHINASWRIERNEAFALFLFEFFFFLSGSVVVYNLKWAS